MASQLTPHEVAHIAELARLELSPTEQETFARQLTDILTYAATVQQVDTTGIHLREGYGGQVGPAAATTGGPERPAWRSDTPTPGTSRDDAIAEAPDGVPEAGFFRVPKVI